MQLPTALALEMGWEGCSLRVPPGRVPSLVTVRARNSYRRLSEWQALVGNQASSLAPLGKEAEALMLPIPSFPAFPLGC